MQKIANYKCHILPSILIDKHLPTDEIDTVSNKIFDHEILIWNNEYPFSKKKLRSFPKLKMFISWGVEDKSIDCEGELKERRMLIKKMSFNYIKTLSNEAQEIDNNTRTFYFKKYRLKVSNTIYITRHGETEWNKQDIFQGRLDSPLTSKGIKHAQSIAKHFSGKQVSCIFSSPLGRSQETARIIASKINTKVIIIPEFQEMHFGVFQGKKSQIIKRQFSEFFMKRQQDPYYKLFISYPEGESYFDVYIRIIKALMSLLAQYNNFIIVGHESLNRILRGVIKGLPLVEAIASRQENNEIIAIDLTKKKEEVIYV